MSRFSNIRQKLREMNLDPESLSDAQKLMVYRNTLQEIAKFLLTVDARKLTEESLEVFINDLADIIRGVDELRRSSISHEVSSIDGIVFHLRSARNELYVASDMVSVKRTISYYRCIDKARDYVAQALDNF